MHEHSVNHDRREITGGCFLLSYPDLTKTPFSPPLEAVQLFFVIPGKGSATRNPVFPFNYGCRIERLRRHVILKRQPKNLFPAPPLAGEIKTSLSPPLAGEDSEGENSIGNAGTEFPHPGPPPSRVRELKSGFLDRRGGRGLASVFPRRQRRPSYFTVTNIVTANHNDEKRRT